MTETILPTTFERLTSRHRIRAELEAVTALRVGAGKSFDVAATDQPVIRDGLGNPFLPGSSLKGVLRSGLESLLRGLEHPRLPVCDPLDAQDSCYAKLRAGHKKKEDSKPLEIAEIVKKLCTVCGLFGSSDLAGRLFVHDLPMVTEELPTEIRDGVGINRDLRTAQRGIKYDFEAVPPGSTFRMEMLLENASPLQWALVLKLLRLLDRGQILIGGLTTRGLGRVRFREGTVVLERTDALRLLDGEDFERLDYDEELRNADEALKTYVRGGG